LDSDGFGVLENAVLSDSPSLIQYLLDHGAKWRAPFDDSYHPMDTAARRSLTGSIRQLQRLGLASPRALSLAKDPVVIAILQDDQSDNGRRFLADETNWPLVLEEPDPSRRLPRVAAHVEAGGNLNHPSQLWRSPLSYALLKNDPALARWMIDRGARPGDKVLLFPPDGGWQQGTALRRWFASQRRLKPDETADPVADEIAVAYLELLWKHEPSSASRGDMLRWAKNAGLTRAAAWINEHF
jgi:hypothetical protein